MFWSALWSPNAMIRDSSPVIGAYCSHAGPEFSPQHPQGDACKFRPKSSDTSVLTGHLQFCPHWAPAMLCAYSPPHTHMILKKKKIDTHAQVFT